MKARARGPSRFRRVAVLALTAATAALAVLVLFAPSVFSSVLRGAGLWPHADRYTALYFTQPSALPGGSGPRSGLPVAFAIESHEAGPRRYTFTVTVGRNADSQRVVQGGALTLSPGHSKVETVELRGALRRRQLVEVRLSGGDTISYWTS